MNVSMNDRWVKVFWAYMLIMMFMFTCMLADATAERLIIWNCERGTAVGWVTWDDETRKSYTSGVVAVYGRAGTVIDPAEYKVYAITQFDWSGNAIIDYKETEIKPNGKDVTIKFSCDGDTEEF